MESIGALISIFVFLGADHSAWARANEPAPSQPLPQPGAVAVEVVHQRVDFVVNSFTDFGGTTLYSCSRVQGVATEILRKLGASNIEVSCIGDHGVDQPSTSPRIHVAFDNVQELGAAPGHDAPTGRWRRVVLFGNDCQLANQLLMRLGPIFEVQGMRDQLGCSTSDMPYSMTVWPLTAD